MFKMHSIDNCIYRFWWYNRKWSISSNPC